MKNEDVENMLNRLQVPQPENIMDQPVLKIPMLSYRKSSKAGLWLLLVPFIVALMIFLKTVMIVESDYINMVDRFFSAIDNNVVLTYLIPLIFIGLPLLALIMNVLAICHFDRNLKSKELIITIKYRPRNIAIILISFAVVIFFLLPDMLAF